MTIRTRAFATHIMIHEENSTAYGVRYVNNEGRGVVVRANQEVILSAGAIQSPHILMLSGIGERAHLESFGIQVKSDLAGILCHQHY